MTDQEAQNEREHAEHVTVEAWPAHCLEGECEHAVDENGYDTDAECPPIQFTVCVDCMDEKGAGRTEHEWSDREVGLEPWPHPGTAGWTETPPERLLCPECAAGKHPSCAHFAFDADDEQVDCQCGCEPSRTCPSCSDTVPPGWTLDDHHNCNHPEDFT